MNASNLPSSPHDTTKNLRGQSLGRRIQLSPHEVSAIVNQVSREVPSGSVRGIILNGLVNLQRRRLDEAAEGTRIRTGFSRMVDNFTYWVLFAAPAAGIWAYQRTLRMLGKTPEDAFPEGTWQFYVEYALREDSARHANETHGFDTVLNAHGIRLNPEERLTAWAMAAIHTLHQYPELLANEWRERVFSDLLRRVTIGTPYAARYAKLYTEWQSELPYRRGSDVGQNETYPAYRRRKFDQFIYNALQNLPHSLHHAWREQARQAQQQDLEAYQRQMSILAYLEPGAHGETRKPYPLSEAKIGIIFRRRYYLIPACDEKGAPPSIETVRAQIAGLLATPPSVPPARLDLLAEIQRAALPKVISGSDKWLRAALEELRRCPILINADQRPANLCLSEIRRTERGVGDHALTLFDTGKTFIFDQSHIFFDGAWGAALAEIITNEALAWAVYLNAVGAPAQPVRQSVQPLGIRWRPEDLQRISKAPRGWSESWAENDQANIKAIMALRKLFKRRSDLIQLTVNDILVLYRAIHAATYQPSAELLQQVNEFAQQHPTQKTIINALQTLLQSKPENPGILIPVDASRRYPRDRLYPMTFEVPLEEMDLLNLHRNVVNALEDYRRGEIERAKAYEIFDRYQRDYLTALAGFGGVLSRAKEIAITGESASVGSIKLLAHMPTPLQRLLDRYSGQFDLLNDIIKGREVFSNVGQVAPNSTLTRFLSAKDDNEKKDLVWGVLTDNRGVMRLTLRDFRPHVRGLVLAGRQDLANRIAQEYLDTYAVGLNQFVTELRRITVASRETRMSSSHQLSYVEY